LRSGKGEKKMRCRIEENEPCPMEQSFGPDWAAKKEVWVIREICETHCWMDDDEDD